MVKIVGVTLGEKKKTYFFDSSKFELHKDDNVIVETEKGLQYGLVVQETTEVSEKDIGFQLKNVIRIATDDDRKQYEKNKTDALEALKKAREIAVKLNLNMRIIDASYIFDRNQLLFNFLADARVDFRELAKKLAQNYRTRIELRQIGVRDRAKEIGGLGPCGRFFCCSTFLTDFNSVSINMAKNQMLALNPSKINGVCGRLLCCLNYEDEIYTDLKRKMPAVGQFYKKNEVEGKVLGFNLFKNTVTIETKNRLVVEVDL